MIRSRVGVLAAIIGCAGAAPMPAEPTPASSEMDAAANPAFTLVDAQCKPASAKAEATTKPTRPEVNAALKHARALDAAAILASAPPRGGPMEEGVPIVPIGNVAFRTPSFSAPICDAETTIRTQILPGAKRCYQKGLEADPCQSSLGNLVVRIKVAPDGQVDTVDAESITGLSEHVVGCTLAVARRAMFDGPGAKGSTITVPIDFVTLPLGFPLPGCPDASGGQPDSGADGEASSRGSTIPDAAPNAPSGVASSKGASDAATAPPSPISCSPPCVAPLLCIQPSGSSKRYCGLPPGRGGDLPWLRTSGGVPIGHVDLGPLASTLPVSNAESVMRTQIQPGARRCYQKGLETDASQSGALVLLVRVAPNGDVESVNVDSNTGLSQPVANCTMKVAERAKFDAPGTTPKKLAADIPPAIAEAVSQPPLGVRSTITVPFLFSKQEMPQHAPRSAEERSGF